MHPYVLYRSKRKTVSLQIARDLRVVVRAPWSLPRATIDRFVAQHGEWIETHRTRLSAVMERKASFQHADGEYFPVLGDPLQIVSGKKPAVCEGYLLLPAGEGRPQQLVRLLREIARERAQQRIEYFAPRMGAWPEKVKITSAKTRWGSCSGTGGVCFSWRTACLPDDLFDYIVVHELAHIREHNHSARFWKLVADIVPDWTRRRAALHQFQEQIPI